MHDMIERSIMVGFFILLKFFPQLKSIIQKYALFKYEVALYSPVDRD